LKTNLKNKIMYKEAEKFIERYTTKDKDDWMVQKKDIIAKFMVGYYKEQLRICEVSQRSELLDFIEEVASDEKTMSSEGIKRWALKLLKSNCG
jgi:hypothetical protein